ncbi:MAG: RNA polymerase sigma factor [Planctomycetes bacterium]|nr:RNA polymerase sigma factor [Planctomycetota bacterium]
MLHSTHNPLDAQALAGRLLELWEQTGDAALLRLARGLPPHGAARFASEQERADWTSTCLMDSYKNTGEPAVFALLFELNRGAFLHAIHCSLRRVPHQIDEHDVLQEVFLNIYRYPHRFVADRADAFRGWGHRIARNTLLKFLKGRSRLARFQSMDEDVLQPEDVRTRRPDRAASEAESAGVVNGAYVLYLSLYLLHFERLSAKERLALTMVEVDGVSYRDAAAALGIRLENLKMVIFRGRRKIFRGMERSLGELGGAALPAALPGELRHLSAAACGDRATATPTRAGFVRVPGHARGRDPRAVHD